MGYDSLGTAPYRKTIGVGVGARVRGQYKGFYDRFLNSGTVERFRVTKSGKKVTTGKITGTNFFTDAVKDNESNVVADLEINIIARLNQLMMKGKI